MTSRQYLTGYGFEAGRRWVKTKVAGGEYATESEVNRPGVSLALPHLALCKEGWCAVEQDGYPLYFDDNHLSTHGARLVAASLKM